MKRRRPMTHRRNAILVAGLVIIVAAAYLVGRYDTAQAPAKSTVNVGTPVPTPAAVSTGKLLNAGTAQTYNTRQIESTVRWRYGNAAPTPDYSVTYRLIQYTSLDENGQKITEYARVYIPQDTLSPPSLLAFAPGTTGIGDACAASLEQPTVVNWGDYNAHFLAYASQGMIVVSPDYQGMRDPTQLHHYMIGELEGRALLDAIQAAYQVPELAGQVHAPVFLAGYSQGGQAALWADQIRSSYAPNLSVTGLVVFAPVSSVLSTWQGILHGTTIDWFGPLVLASYSDYYHNDPGINEILQPKWQTNFLADATSHCIDSLQSFYGTKPAALYTPQFLSALSTGNLAAAGFGTLGSELTAQNVTQATSTPKLLLQGTSDTTILPSQTAAERDQLCQMGSGRVHEETFAGSTHYTVVVNAFSAALSWMKNLENGNMAPTDCGK